MTRRLKLTLSGMWLVTGLVSLGIPIFLPSWSSSWFVTTPIGAATVTMFILSFPMSVFATPVLYLINIMVGINPSSLQGMYGNLVMLFILGIVQWFWLVPRIWGRQQMVQSLELSAVGPGLLGGALKTSVDEFDQSGKTPLERAIRDRD